MGLKAKRGVEVVGHLYRALHEDGWVIATTDFTNGFNAFSRQAMMDAVQTACPELLPAFNKYYAMDSVCLLKLQNGSFERIWSREGSRMGCTVGSLGFDVTVDPVYKGVQSLFPESVAKALTDDYTAAFKAPGNDHRFDDGH